MALTDAIASQAAGHGAGDPLPALGEMIATGVYRHYKGGRYEVLGLVRHSETLEVMVLYRALDGERGLWVRPRAMFEQQVTVDGISMARFAPAAGRPTGDWDNAMSTVQAPAGIGRGGRP